jgi:hypothetical protein
MTRAWRHLVLLAALATPVFAAGQAPPRAIVTRPYAGIRYIDRVVSTPRAEHMHIVQIDLTAPGIRLKLTPPSGDRETTRQTTLAFLEQEHAEVAINGHFFLPFPSTDTSAWVIGLAASEGRVYSAFESPEQSFALVANAPAINIDHLNHAAIVHRDASQADGLHVREPVELWTAIAGSAQIVTDGHVTIPMYRDEAHPEGALTPGSARHYQNGNSWYDAINARSALGLSRDNRTLTLFTVDARGGSAGMTIGEVAERMIADYDVWNAINIDGGGSTSLALRDPATGRAALVNTSSDNADGRSVASSLVVFAKPPTAPQRYN